DDELAPGIVAGAPAEPPPATDASVELGHIDMRSSPQVPLPSVDLELGAPGASPGRAPTDETVIEDVPLGVAGPGAVPAVARANDAANDSADTAPVAKTERSDVSIALSDHVDIDRDDVKDAVRQS